MKYTYSQQAVEIRRLSKLVLECDKEILREAGTTLNALALVGEETIFQAQGLKKVCQEFVMEVLTDKRELNFAEVRQYAMDLQKILNQKQ